jgi:hypothetical protein
MNETLEDRIASLYPALKKNAGNNVKLLGVPKNPKMLGKAKPNMKVMGRLCMC